MSRTLVYAMSAVRSWILPYAIDRMVVLEQAGGAKRWKRRQTAKPDADNGVHAHPELLNDLQTPNPVPSLSWSITRSGIVTWKGKELIMPAKEEITTGRSG